jgi:hypothetical protein
MIFYHLFFLWLFNRHLIQLFHAQLISFSFENNWKYQIKASIMDCDESLAQVVKMMPLLVRLLAMKEGTHFSQYI